MIDTKEFALVSTTMAVVEDYAKAVHDGDDSACHVLRQTIAASLDQAEGTIEAQAAEIERLRVDAERYRWIRNRVQGLRNFRTGLESFEIAPPTPCMASIMRGSVAQHFDEAIDAAIAKEKTS